MVVNYRHRNCSGRCAICDTLVLAACRRALGYRIGVCARRAVGQLLVGLGPVRIAGSVDCYLVYLAVAVRQRKVVAPRSGRCVRGLGFNNLLHREACCSWSCSIIVCKFRFILAIDDVPTSGVSARRGITTGAGITDRIACTNWQVLQYNTLSMLKYKCTRANVIQNNRTGSSIYFCINSSSNRCCPIFYCDSKGEFFTRINCKSFRYCYLF